MNEKVIGMLQPFCCVVYRILFLTGVSMMQGCGGGGTEAPDPVSNAMQIGKEYSLEPGSRLVKTSVVPANITIKHDLEAGSKYVILNSGSADLLLR